MSLESVHQGNTYEARAADWQSLQNLGHQIVELAGHLNAANYRLLILIAEWDRRKGWSDGATASCAHWLNIWTPPAVPECILHLDAGTA